MTSDDFQSVDFQGKTVYIYSIPSFLFWPLTLSLSSSFLSVIPSSSSYPNFQLFPLPSERCWTASEGDRYCSADRRYERRANRGDGAVWWHRHQRLSKTDREAVRQGHNTTRKFKHKLGDNGLCTATEHPHPQLTGFPLHWKLSLLSLKPHVSLHESLRCFVPILSSFLSSVPFSAWLGAVWSLTLFTSEGSPWSEVSLFPPAKPSSTEVIRCSPGLNLLSWLHTHTQTHNHNTQVFPSKARGGGSVK